MRITLIDAGKRFNRDWIFRHLSHEFHMGHSYAIVGPNGSGKSTLLQSLAGAIAISEGTIQYDAIPAAAPGARPAAHGHVVAANGHAQSPGAQPEAHGHAASPGAQPPANTIPPDQAYRHLSLAAPYLQLIEEMTVTEFLQFHAAFKALLPDCPAPEIIRRVGLGAAAHKQIRYYSSGMKQRVRLAQALFSDTPIVLLDEPCTNLDADGIALYRQLIREYTRNRLVVVSSNDPQEYEFCEEKIDIRNYR